MFVTCKLPLFVLCDENSVTIAYSVGNKNTHIDNLHGTYTWPIERETAVHDCHMHGPGDMAAFMQMILSRSWVVVLVCGLLL